MQKQTALTDLQGLIERISPDLRLYSHHQQVCFQSFIVPKIVPAAPEFLPK